MAMGRRKIPPHRQRPDGTVRARQPAVQTAGAAPVMAAAASKAPRGVPGSRQPQAADLTAADSCDGAADDDDGDTGALRRCLVTGERHPPAALLRFAVDPAGVVVFDAAGRLPGRGLWLRPERAMVETACAKALFSRAARASVRAPADLPDTVERLLRTRCLDRLGLARRAGALTWGYERVRDWLETGRAALVLGATDGAAGGRAKIRGLARGLPVVAAFRADEMGAALGQEPVVHVAVATGPFAGQIAGLVARLQTYVTNGAANGDAEARETDE